MISLCQELATSSYFWLGFLLALVVAVLLMLSSPGEGRG